MTMVRVFEMGCYKASAKSYAFMFFKTSCSRNNCIGVAIIKCSFLSDDLSLGCHGRCGYKFPNLSANCFNSGLWLLANFRLSGIYLQTGSRLEMSLQVGSPNFDKLEWQRFKNDLIDDWVNAFTTALWAVMNSDKAVFREFMIGLFRYVS